MGSDEPGGLGRLGGVAASVGLSLSGAVTPGEGGAWFVQASSAAQTRAAATGLITTGGASSPANGRGLLTSERAPA